MAGRRKLDQRGVSVLEFGLVLPLLLLMVFSIIDFGLYFFSLHTLQFATREGVRLALVGRALSDDEGNAMTREQSIVETIEANASIALDPADLLIAIYPVDAEYGDPEDWQNIRDAGGPGDYMRVRTRYDYHFISPLLGALAGDGRLVVRAEATYRNEMF